MTSRNHSATWRAAAGIMIAVSASLLAGCGSRQQPEAQVAPQSSKAALTAGDETSGLLQKWCADCHLPPLAQAHKVQEWRYIVLRMQKHRTSGGLPAIAAQDMEKLISYFESHAQP